VPNPLPFTVRVKAALPTAALAGTSWEIDELLLLGLLLLEGEL